MNKNDPLYGTMEDIMSMPPAERLEWLGMLLNSWSSEYYNSEHPSVSDGVYDAHYQILLKTEKQYPALKRIDSPTNKVGAKA